MIPGESPEGTLSKFEELLKYETTLNKNWLISSFSKYRMMEISLNNKRMRMQNKLEDLKKSMASVEGLKSNATSTFQFELNDTLYTKARLPPQCEKLETIHLWLGANVMLSYPVEEGLKLLREKKGEAEGIVKKCEEDLLYVRDQITTMEVNTARVYNLLVQCIKK